MSIRVEKFGNDLNLDDIVGQNPQTKAADTVLDLPLNLAFLEVEAALPKLSVLSSGGIE